MPTERIGLTQPIETRDGTLSKDSRSTNCVFESRDEKREFIKRPGLLYGTNTKTTVDPTTSANISRGLGQWYQGVVAVVLNAAGTAYDVIYIRPQTNGAYLKTTIGSSNPSTSYAQYVSFARMTLDSYLLVNDGDAIQLIASGGGALAAPTTPPPAGGKVYGSVFLDNYFFIGYTSNNRIYNCNVGDPNTWDPLNYITFEQTSDSLVAITRHLNYLVAFGKSSLQFYYDAANATGSPLAVAQSYSSEVGCAGAATVASSDNTTMWVGQARSAGRAVYMLDGVSPIRVSTTSIDKVLRSAALFAATAYMCRVNGHSLYVLNLIQDRITLVYDLNEKMWYQWTQYCQSVYGDSGSSYYIETYFRPAFHASFTLFGPFDFMLDNDTGYLYKLDPSTYQDYTQSIYCRTVTDLSDNGTTKRKFYGRLEIVGDKTSGATMQIRHTGDDYNTWSSYRTVDLNASRSQIYLGGADRRRAWEFLVTSNTPLRLESAEIDFRLGEMDQEQGIGGGRYRR
jgi:hypothetical protein